MFPISVLLTVLKKKRIYHNQYFKYDQDLKVSRRTIERGSTSFGVTPVSFHVKSVLVIIYVIQDSVRLHDFQVVNSQVTNKDVLVRSITLQSKVIKRGTSS